MPIRTLKTKRLLLRPLSAEDAYPIAELGGDWDVASMTSRMPYPYTLDAAHQWIGGIDEGERVFGIEFEKKLVGVTGYSPGADPSTVEVGYWLGKPFWGKGLATEAASRVIEHCFVNEGIGRITCGHYLDNPASARVIEKLGFEPTGTELWWCEARQRDVEARRYKLDKPPVWKILAARLARTPAR